MTAVPLIHNPGASAALATVIGTKASAGTGGATTSTSITGDENVLIVNVFDVDVLGATGCPISDVESIQVSAVYTKTANVDTTEDGSIVLVGDIGALSVLPSPTAVDGDLGPSTASGFPGGVSRDYTASFFGGTLAASGDPIGATWAVPPGQTVLQVAVFSDAPDTGLMGGLPGETVSVSLPTRLVRRAPRQFPSPSTTPRRRRSTCRSLST